MIKEKGDSMYKVEFYPDMDMNFETSFVQTCETLEQTNLISNTIADYTLFLHSKGLMKDFSNSVITYQFKHGEWIEIGEDGIEI